MHSKVKNYALVICLFVFLFVIPAVKLAGVNFQLPRQPRRRLPSLHTAHRRQLELSAEPPFRHTDPPSLNSIGELVVSKLGSTPRLWFSVCLCFCSSSSEAACI